MLRRVIAALVCAKACRISSDSAASRCQLTSRTGRSMTGGRRLKLAQGSASRLPFQDAVVLTLRRSEATPRSDCVNFFILDSDDVSSASWFRKGNQECAGKLKRDDKTPAELRHSCRSTFRRAGSVLDYLAGPDAGIRAAIAGSQPVVFHSEFHWPRPA